MTRPTFISPALPVRYCRLINARPSQEDGKPDAWSCQLLIKANDKDGQKFLKTLEQTFSQCHGTAKRSANGIPWGPDRDDPTTTVVRLKLPVQIGKTSQEAPKLVDAATQPWAADRWIGDGSKMRIQGDVYAWTYSGSAGMTLEPRKAQVVEFVAYEKQADTEDCPFEAIAGGFAAVEADDDDLPF